MKKLLAEKYTLIISVVDILHNGMKRSTILFEIYK